jgi:DNA-dependent RNA polymerase auxiliary subunit epsilon
MMTRKDYVETARILNKYKEAISEKDFIDLVDDFSFMYEQDNERFNTEKFLEAVNK